MPLLYGERVNCSILLIHPSRLHLVRGRQSLNVYEKWRLRVHVPMMDKMLQFSKTDYPPGK